MSITHLCVHVTSYKNNIFIHKKDYSFFNYNLFIKNSKKNYIIYKECMKVIEQFINFFNKGYIL